MRLSSVVTPCTRFRGTENATLAPEAWVSLICLLPLVTRLWGVGRMAFSLAVTLFLLGSYDDWHPLLSSGRIGAPPLFCRGELSCYPVSQLSSNASNPIGLSNWNPRRSTPLVKP